MTISQQIDYKKKYLLFCPNTCKKTSYFQISFPYCEHGYTCIDHCHLWFHFYFIDFDKYHRNDPNRFIQLTLF